MSQDKHRIELWRHTAGDSDWAYSVHSSGDVVELRSIGCHLDVNELYAAAGLAKA